MSRSQCKPVPLTFERPGPSGQPPSSVTKNLQAKHVTNLFTSESRESRLGEWQVQELHDASGHHAVGMMALNLDRRRVGSW